MNFHVLITRGISGTRLLKTVGLYKQVVSMCKWSLKGFDYKVKNKGEAL